MTRMLLASLIALSAWQGGCKRKLPTLEEMKEANRKEMGSILEKHRTAATAKLEAIKAVAADAKAAAPVTVRQPATVSLAVPPEAAGLVLANLEWAAAANGMNEAKLRVKDALPLGTLTGALANGHAYGSSYNVQGIDRQFGLLVALKQAALIRIQRYDPPKAVAGPGGRRFQSGRAAGDVLVYDLETRKRIGAFPFEAMQRDTAGVGQRDGEALLKELERSFAYDFETAINGELAAFAKGKAGPAAPGAAADASLRRFTDKIWEQLTLDHLLSGPKEIDFATGAGGSLIATIRAENPSHLAARDGAALPDVRRAVVKILGREATVKVVKSGP